MDNNCNNTQSLPQEQDEQAKKSSSKEAKVTLVLYFSYFLWTIVSAYGLGSANPSEYTMILGFPAWFFYSCIIAYPLCCLAVYFLTKHFFNDIQKAEK